MTTATFRPDDNNSNTYARYPVKVINQLTTFVTADGTTAKKIAEGTTTVLGSRINKILISSDDTTSNIIKFYLHDGTSLSPLPIGFIAILNNSGDGSDTAKNVVSVLRSEALDPIVELDNNGNPYLLLSTEYSLYASVTTAITAAKTIQVAVWLDDY